MTMSCSLGVANGACLPYLYNNGSIYKAGTITREGAAQL
jgi:hypothetical protein